MAAVNMCDIAQKMGECTLKTKKQAVEPKSWWTFYIGHKDGNTKTLNKHYAATDPAQITAAFWQYGAAA